MYKVRFHLARGENYMKWQVSMISHEAATPSGIRTEINYYDPKKTKIIMINCKLNNVFNIANKIFLGENKKVCAWISCENLFVSNNLSDLDNFLGSLTYNPRIFPHWSLNGTNVDNNYYNCLITKDNKVYIKDE